MPSGDKWPGGVVLSGHGLTKRFGATQALSDVELRLHRGEVHGLIGENGCGKSTLVKILAGVYKADSGELTGGEDRVDARRMTPAMSHQMGIRVVHQDAPVFADLNVGENLVMGRSFPRTRYGTIDRGALRRETRAVLARFDVPASPDQLCGSLSPAVQTLLSIAKALQDQDAQGERMLVLDEPTAALTDREVKILLDAVRRYAAAGQSILLVTHRLDEILDVCDSVTVMRDGKNVARPDRHEMSRDSLIDMMLGQTLAAGHGRDHDRVRDGGGVALEVRDLVAPRVGRTSLRVERGEIVGLAGLLGSGRTELLHAIFGASSATGGEILVAGKGISSGSVRNAMRAGVALVPENRTVDASFAPMSARENLAVNVLDRFSRNGVLRRGLEASVTQRLLGEFDVSPPEGSTVMGKLSGGNQQKVVMARWLQREPAVLLLDEPTQGVDVGARARIYLAIRRAAEGGTGVLVASSDGEELVELCDRVLILVSGRIVGELSGEQITRSRITTGIQTTATPEGLDP